MRHSDTYTGEPESAANVWSLILWAIVPWSSCPMQRGQLRGSRILQTP